MSKKAKDVMSSPCECIGEGETVEAAARKLADLNVGSMPICGDDDKLKGMLTDRDIVVKVISQGGDPSQVTASELAEGTPVMVDADDSIEDALEKMAESKIRRLPVIENKKLVGIVSQADIAKELPEEKTGDLVESISAAP
jgi:CBS domain-containing protein